MQINDCTLCLLPRTCSQESLVELYLLLTKLPIIVEYPEAIGFLLKAKGLLTENSKVLSQLPKQNSNFVPDFGGKLQKNDEILFPVNDFGLAGAVAFCGFLAGGIVRVSFGGLNNTAATEELLLAAYVTGATKQDLDGLVILPQIAVVLQQITGRVIPQHKPVIGGKIFVVESGIHEVTGLYIIDGLIAGNFAVVISALHHIILPAVCLAYVQLAIVARQVRSSMIDVLEQDYIRTAKSCGISRNTIIYKYALKNALLPTLTVTGLTVGELLGGAIITETIFAWPGMGKYVMDSIAFLDFPAIMGFTLVVSLSYVLINMAVDVLYSFLNPQIREVEK